MKNLLIAMFVFCCISLSTTAARAALPSREPGKFSEQEWQEYTKQQVRYLFPNDPIALALEVTISGDVEDYAGIDWYGKELRLFITRRCIAILANEEEFLWLLAHEFAHPKLNQSIRQAIQLRAVIRYQPQPTSALHAEALQADRVVSVPVVSIVQVVDFNLVERIERTADLFAVRTMNDMGYSRCAGARLLGRILQDSKSDPSTPEMKIHLRRVRMLQSLCQ